MKTLLADLGETYKRSSIIQLKALMGSMFPTGLAWRYKGTLKHQISPLYQYIRTFNEDTIPSGTLNANKIELLLLWIFKMMEAYSYKSLNKHFKYSF